MTPADLARIAAAIAADAETLNANWPLARDRERAYLALGRAVAALAEDGEVAYLATIYDVHSEDYDCQLCYCKTSSTRGGVIHRHDCPAAAVDAALAALAPAEQEAPDA